MSIYYRLCPHDSHTCSNRACLEEPRDLCVAQRDELAKKDPAKTSSQVQLDEHHYVDCC